MSIHGRVTSCLIGSTTQCIGSSPTSSKPQIFRTVEILLTGDAEIPSEEDMLAAGVLMDVDVLKIGHHGSRTSSSNDFLAITSPEIGIISAGLDNQYGHPHTEVVDRLDTAGVELLFTDISDADDTIVLSSDCQSYYFALGGSPIATPSPSTDTEPTTTPSPEATDVVRLPEVGEILINEFLADPSSGSEWIELYNTSDSQLKLSGMWLDDIVDGGKPPMQIPAKTLIAPGGFYIHDIDVAYLNNGGDDVRLLGTDQATVFDSFTYTSSQKGVSRCREPDGGAWSESCAPTKGTTN